MTQVLSDDPLLKQAIAGDAAAFDALLAPLYDPAFRLATVLLKDSGEAEDAVQEGALKAWSQIRQLRGDRDAMRAWFLSIVANQCRTMRRRVWWSVLRLPELATGLGWAEEATIRKVDLSQAIGSLSHEDKVAVVA